MKIYCKYSIQSENSLQKQLLLLLFFMFSMTGYAANYRMQRIDSRDGLSNSAVLSIYQDDKGYVWVGTYNGLNRYDGKFVESYFLGETNNGAQSSNIIQHIQGADSNHLWISAYMGLSKFSTSQNKVEESYSEYRSPYNLATNGRGLTCLIAKKNQLSIYDPANRLRVYSLDGRCLFDKTASASESKELQTGHILPKGIYIYSLTVTPGVAPVCGKIVVK